MTFLSGEKSTFPENNPITSEQRLCYAELQEQKQIVFTLKHQVAGIQWGFVPKSPSFDKSCWIMIYHNSNSAALFWETDLLSEKWLTNHLKGLF